MGLTVAHLPWLVLWLTQEGAAGSGMGASSIVVKFAQKCDLDLPTLQPLDYRISQRRGVSYMSANTTLKYKFSDKYGLSCVVAVKKSGRWVPNFFKGKLQNVCSMTKLGQPELFKMIAKMLNAPEPYTCPLPRGTISYVDYAPDMASIQSLAGNVLPYGEFKLEANVTHKADVQYCIIFYIDVVPQKNKKKG